MITDMYVSLNDFYYEIGLQEIKLGDNLGWSVNKGLIDINIDPPHYQQAENGEPCIVLDYIVPPYYEYDR